MPRLTKRKGSKKDKIESNVIQKKNKATKKLKIYKTRYTSDTLVFCVDQIKNKNITLEFASILYNIPKSTLRDQLKKKEKLDKRKKTTDLENERIFEEFLRYREMGHAVSNIFLLELAKDVTGKNVGRKWFDNFRKLKGIVFKYGGQKSVARYTAESDPKKTTSFDAFLGGFYEKHPNFPPENIINIDETGLNGFTNVPKRTNEVKGTRKTEIKKTSEKIKSMTLVVTVSASGKMYRPTILYKGARITKQLEPLKNYLDKNPEKGLLVMNKSGYMMTKKTWMDHIRSIQKSFPRGVILLLVDGHQSHTSLEFARFCEDKLIIVIFFPSHMSHKLQPLDITVNADIKRIFRTLYNNYYNVKLQDNITVGKYLITVLESVEKVKSESIISSFRETGIYPFGTKEY